jgi:hypothetical protein
VPWCDECAKFWSPPSVSDGACPTCGSVLEAPSRPNRQADTAPGDAPVEVVHAKAPWHFKLLLVALILYLGYRAYQGIAWLIVNVPHWI